MGLNTGAVGQGQGSTSHYGHADYARDKANGLSDAELLKKIHADPSKMGNGGVGGDLYNQIARGAQSSGSSSSSNSGSSSGRGSSYNSNSHRDQKMAGSQEFQNNLNEATQAYRPEPVDMNKYEQGGYDEDFVQGMKNEQAIKETDPFGDSWNSIDFAGKHLTIGREAQKGRGDASGITNKYIFNAAQTNPLDIQALDQQIRTNPLYSEAKADLSKLNTYGDQYASGSPNWINPSAPSEYEAPDFGSIYDKTKDDINSIKL